MAMLDVVLVRILVVKLPATVGNVTHKFRLWRHSSRTVVSLELLQAGGCDDGVTEFTRSSQGHRDHDLAGGSLGGLVLGSSLGQDCPHLLVWRITFVSGY